MFAYAICKASQATLAMTWSAIVTTYVRSTDAWVAQTWVLVFDMIADLKVGFFITYNLEFEGMDPTVDASARVQPINIYYDI